MSVADESPTPDLVEVAILNFPLELFLRAQEHADGLIREFTLISQDRATGNSVDVPERLLAIVEELSTRYAGLGSEPEAIRDAAIEAGERYVDLRYVVPTAVGAASEHLGDIFDAADEYCRAGRHLLSVATPPDALEFRRWFLGEFVKQIGGAPPTPWPHQD